jgi:hypothetical protein
MCLGEALFLSRWLLFCHDCFPEVRLGRRNAASHRYVYTNIAHSEPAAGTLTEDRLRAHRPTEVSNFAQTQLD